MNNDDRSVKARYAAERMRRHHERRRNGFRSVSLNIHEREIDLLVRKAFLQMGARHDREALSQALRAFIGNAFDRARRRDRPGCFTVDLDADDLEHLVRRGRLLAEERRDPDAVLRAFSEVVHEAFWRL